MAHDDWDIMLSLIPDLTLAKVSASGDVVCGADMNVNIEMRLLHDFFDKIREQEHVVALAGAGLGLGPGGGLSRSDSFVEGLPFNDTPKRSGSKPRAAPKVQLPLLRYF